LETSRGALINSLLQYPLVTVYPVNPDALANYRKTFNHGGGKSDPVDARLILQYLQHYRTQPRPLQIDQPLTRELASLCIVTLLLKFTTLKETRIAGRTKLRNFFFGIGTKASAEARIEILMNAKPLTTDDDPPHQRSPSPSDLWSTAIAQQVDQSLRSRNRVIGEDSR
jgi:hypothetical protein